MIVVPVAVDADRDVGAVDGDVPPALVVSDVVAHSPAASAGLIPGDEITHVDGHPVHDSDEVAARVAGLEGSCVQIRGIRNGKTVNFSVIRRAMWRASASAAADRPPPPTSSSPLPAPRAINFSSTQTDTATAVSALKISLHEACVASFPIRPLHLHQVFCFHTGSSVLTRCSGVSPGRKTSAKSIATMKRYCFLCAIVWTLTLYPLQ
jgi:membrane-associated protease RseP (regulator of RpoE activity)